MREPVHLTEEAGALLLEWGLAVDHELRVLVCWSCGNAIKSSPKEVLRHLESKHSKKGKTILGQHPSLGQQLEAALGDYPFRPPDEVKFQPTDRAPVKGITVHRGFYCPVLSEDGSPCCVTYREPASLYEHVKKKHECNSNRPKQNELLGFSCDCQTIFNSNHRRYFRVKTEPKGPPEDSRNPYTAFVQEEQRMMPGGFLEAIKPEELPSLLRVTQWHMFVGDHRENPKDVVDLIQHPARSSGSEGSSEDQMLSKLPRISEAWLADVGGYWKESSEWIRRVLNGYPM